MITTEKYNELREERKELVQKINSLCNLELGRTYKKIKDIDKLLTIYEKGVNYCFICGSELVETGMGLLQCTHQECKTHFCSYVDNDGSLNVNGSI